MCIVSSILSVPVSRAMSVCVCVMCKPSKKDAINFTSYKWSLQVSLSFCRCWIGAAALHVDSGYYAIPQCGEKNKDIDKEKKSKSQGEERKWKAHTIPVDFYIHFIFCKYNFIWIFRLLNSLSLSVCTTCGRVYGQRMFVQPSFMSKENTLNLLAHKAIYRRMHSYRIDGDLLPFCLASPWCCALWSVGATTAGAPTTSSSSLPVDKSGKVHIGHCTETYETVQYISFLGASSPRKFIL